jgi:signal transduction histidine kinase/ligand-binding sensor domain-containing protein
LCLGSTAAAEHVRFERIGKDKGLSSLAVSSIAQDSRGFLWFGTQSGLNRYDGYEFEIYRKKPFDPNSLSHDLIQTMYLEEEKGILWIGTYQGLNRYDIRTKTFTRYRNEQGDETSLSDDVVVSIYRDSQGALWVGTLDGLNRFDEESGTFIRYLADPDDPESISNNTIRCIREDGDGRLWIGTYGGLNRYHRKEERFTSYRHEEGNPDSLPSDYVMTIRRGEPGSLWIGTWGGSGLARFDIEAERFRRYELPDDRTYTLNVQEEGKLRIGSWGGGLMIMDTDTGKLTRFTKEKSDRHSLSNNIVYSIYEDRSGILWIGTNGGGIDKLQEPKNDFTYYEADEEEPGSIGDGEVNAVYIDSKSTLWAGTYNTGLHRYDGKRDRWVHYRADAEDPRSLSDDIVSCIYEDRKGRLWIGTNNGLNLYNRETDDFTVYNKGPGEDSLNDHIIYDVIEGPEGDLWLGTYNAGVTRWDWETEEMEHYPHEPGKPGSLSDNLVYDLYVDSRGILWVATNDGVNRWVPEEERFVSYYHDEEDTSTLASDNVRTIYETSDGTLWFGTVSGGLNRFDRETETFDHYMKQDGMPANSIYGMLEDDSGRLWISTIDHLTVFDPEEGSFQTIDEDNGIWAEEFSTGHFKAQDGTLYFGTAEGLYQIEPGEFSRNQHVPPVRLTSFRIFDEEVSYDTALTEVEQISLSHEESFFAFTFAALDYTNPDKNRYAYKLEGFDEEWIMSGNRRYASYTNLPPGEYTFKVRGSNNDHVWNEQGTSIGVEVVPPPWRTLPAYLVYGVLGILLIYLLVRQFISRQRRIYAEKTQELERERLALLEKEVAERQRVQEEILAAKHEAEKANRAKSDFIANISHELRTPLNAILGYTQVLQRSARESSVQQTVGSLESNGKQLLALINELLDISAAEAGKLKLYYGPVDLRSILKDLQAVYGPRAGEKGVEFTAAAEEEVPETLYSDSMRIRQILFNLVGNAVKFTRSGFIQVRISSAPAAEERIPEQTSAVSLTLEVKDSGIGISESEKSRVFEAFTQQEGQSGSYGGTGLGLTITRRLAEALGGTVEVESEEGEGSRFLVHFPRVEVYGPEHERSDAGASGELGSGGETGAWAKQKAGASGAPGSGAGAEEAGGELSGWGFAPEDFRPASNRAGEAREAVAGALYDRWREISAAFFIDEWREFARELSGRGQSYGLQALVRYGELLKETLESFDLHRFKELVGLYPSIAEKIRSGGE